MTQVKLSLRALDWSQFASDVMMHIETYTVPQYGDRGADIATDYTAQQCVDQIRKYAARFGKNARAEQDALDLMKIAHYAQMAYRILKS